MSVPVPAAYDKSDSRARSGPNITLDRRRRWRKYKTPWSHHRLPSGRDASLRLPTDTVDPRFGWIAKDHLGIDQGPMLAMIANHRSDTIWRVMRRSPILRRGLQRAGFTGGWLEDGI